MLCSKPLFCTVIALPLVLRLVPAAIGEHCDRVSSRTAYKYQQLAQDYLTNVDDIATVADDAEDWYEEVVAPFQTKSVKWKIVAGDRISNVEGKEAVGNIFRSLSTREFAFHQWSHWEVCEASNDDIVVKCRYHGVVREDGAGNQDIFGTILVRFKTRRSRKGLITEVDVERFETIDRPVS